MSTKKQISAESAWVRDLRNALKAPQLAELNLIEDSAAGMRTILKYPALVTEHLLAIGEPKPNDPILLQCIPSSRELLRISGDAQLDPFHETAERSPMPGVVRRFADRILILTTRGCAMRCRYCTRKNTLRRAPYFRATDENLAALKKFITENKEIREVILSGGDPLVLPTRTIIRYLETLAPLEQLDAIRIGTRVLTALPSRITPQLVAALKKFGGKKLWINTHFNHPRELAPQITRTAIARLADAGIVLSNQSVLLKGVNDDEGVLFELCATLQRNRIRPYYVFTVDPVRGAMHFSVPVERAIELRNALLVSIGGLALPQFVMDIPGAPAKIPIGELERRDEEGA